MMSKYTFKYTFKSLLFSTLGGLTFGETVYQPTECPGLYCGRKSFDNGQFTECGACDRGSQPGPLSVCTTCTGSPDLYGWLYLGFMALLPLLLHFFFIDFTNSKKKYEVESNRLLIILHLSAFGECVIAAIITLLLTEPMGSLNLTSCPVNRLEDWYTMLYNPSLNYTTTLHCTQEIVYPLYTIVMVYYAFVLLLLMCMRPLISYQFVQCRGTKSIYAALYFLPILIVIQAVFGGLLYYSYPYFMIIISLVTSAIHMSTGISQSFKELFKESFCDGRSLTILIGHWILHAYGIISLTELEQPSFHLPLLLLVFFPSLFYIATAKFTDSDNLEKTE